MSTLRKQTQEFAVAGSAFNTVGADLGGFSIYSIQVDFVGGALAGTGKIQASNTDTNYVDVSGATQTIAAGASILLSTSTAGYQYARLVWTPSGGAGTATTTTVLKG